MRCSSEMVSFFFAASNLEAFARIRSICSVSYFEYKGVSLGRPKPFRSKPTCLNHASRRSTNASDCPFQPPASSRPLPSQPQSAPSDLFFPTCAAPSKSVSLDCLGQQTQPASPASPTNQPTGYFNRVPNHFVWILPWSSRVVPRCQNWLPMVLLRWQMVRQGSRNGGCTELPPKWQPP